MRYRRLDENGDMTFGKQQANFLKDSPAAVAQAALTRLKLWTGEWFVDATEGTPYQNGILGYGTRQAVEPILRSRIIETEGVSEITSFDILFDADARKMSISATIDTKYGVAQLQGIM
jgi:hypothetical protein